MSRYAYQEISARSSRSGKCPVCNKRVTRSRTFTQTHNPWNTNPDGTVKTSREVWLAVAALADTWEPDFHHESCIERTQS